MESPMDLEQRYCAHNYHPLPVVLSRGEGAYVWDIEGKRYLDMMSAYSAVSHGHCHPRLVKALQQQAAQLTIVSRAFYSDKLGQFLQKICEMTGQARALPMNTGAEAVETALKAARKWGYKIKGIAHDQAEIIVCENNFHGRTIAIIGMSTEPQYRDGFGPFPAGFKTILYGDVAALRQAITPNTAAFLVEPIQGEAGIIVPPEGYLKACAEICRERNVLLICDEIQTGLGRTGKLLACQHDGVVPDGLILGKALGGGMLPVSAFLAIEEVMAVFTPGDHGSTFGGNPLLVDENLVERSAELGRYFHAQLQAIHTPLISTVRGRGLFIGLEINPALATARSVCERLLQRGILSKETHSTVVRLAPPLVITKEQLDEVVKQLRAVVGEVVKDGGVSR
ncbi:MAG: ornithine--oxo-acid transaminase [Halothiobacillaceae bacterium]|nr:MAG: ornithine--oxo-acid transaminase [Halothiobacillaceae bacterium]